jgi:hypothetical protein
MAVLMALMAGHADGSTAHMAAGMAGGTAGGMAAGPAVLTAVVWVTARPPRIMYRQLTYGTRVPKAVRSTPLVWVYRESGAALMVIGMVAMLV